jgi:hypothetical protein
MATPLPIVEVLSIEGCPHHEQCIALVRRALATEGIAAPIRLIRVATEEEAWRIHFYGSPSVRIDGRDVVPVPEGTTPSVSCRVYRGSDGRLAPIPPYEALVAALRRS